MPAVPSLSSSFTALQKQSAPPPINWGALNLTTPTAAKSSAPAPTFGLSAPKPAIPSLAPTMSASSPQTITPMTNFSNPPTPAVPAMGNLQSNDTALKPGQFGAGPFATISANGTSTPSAFSQMPAIPSITPTTTPTPYTPAPYATTNSGATVDPNTGAVVTGSNPQQANASASIGSNTGNATGAAGYSSSAGGAPAPYGASPYGSSPSDLFGAYMSSLQPSSAESDAINKLTQLNTSAAQGYTNTENQPIALPFITGQQAALQRSQTQLATPLEQQISLLQAQRQMKQTGIQNLLDFTKPVATTYGGTLSRYNPSTGQYDTVVNPFGTATGTATGTGTDITTQIGNAIASGQLTSDQVTRYGIPFIAATLAADPGYNFVTQKASVAANSASLKTQQSYLDTTQRAFNTANENLSAITQFMTTAGVNTGSTIPLINSLTNNVKAGVSDPGTIAAYQAALAGLRAEYAQVLSRGGEVTDTSRNAAATLIPDDLTPAQLQQVASRLNVEGQNAISAATQQVKQITSNVGSNVGGSGGAFSNGSSTSSSSSSSGSIYDF